MTEPGPQRYRKRPTEIQAMFWNGRNTDLITKWCGTYRTDDGERRTIFTSPGAVTMGSGIPTADLWVEANKSIVMVQPNNWIARDRLGFYPIAAEVFNETYIGLDDEEE